MAWFSIHQIMSMQRRCSAGDIPAMPLPLQAFAVFPHVELLHTANSKGSLLPFLSNWFLHALVNTWSYSNQSYDPACDHALQLQYMGPESFVLHTHAWSTDHVWHHGSRSEGNLCSARYSPHMSSDRTMTETRSAECSFKFDVTSKHVSEKDWYDIEF